MTDIRKVKNGKVDASGFPDGADVIVQSVEDTAPFAVDEQEKADLLEAIEQADCGQSVDALAHLSTLRGKSDSAD